MSVIDTFSFGEAAVDKPEATPAERQEVSGQSQGLKLVLRCTFGWCRLTGGVDGNTIFYSI